MCLAVPMKVIELLPPDMAIVELDGVSMDVSLKLVGEVSIGEYVIVHTGFALEILNLEEAEKTLEVLREIAMIEREEFQEHDHASP